MGCVTEPWLSAAPRQFRDAFIGQVFKQIVTIGQIDDFADAEADSVWAVWEWHVADYQIQCRIP